MASERHSDAGIPADRARPSESIARLLEFLDDALDDRTESAPTKGAGFDADRHGLGEGLRRDRGCVRGCGRVAETTGDFCGPCRSWVLGDADEDPVREVWYRGDLHQLRRQRESIDETMTARLRRRHGPKQQD